MKISPRERLALRSEPNSSGCQVWTGPPNHKGYGEVYAYGRPWLAHRLAWVLEHGDIKPGLFVDHLCHNPACIEVGHLRLATPAQNEQNRRGPQRNSTTGIRGVYRQGAYFTVRVGANGRGHYGGYFTSIDDAERAAIALRAKLHDPIPSIA